MASMQRYRAAITAARGALRAGHLTAATFTVPNCAFSKLRDNMKRLKHAFHYMIGSGGGGGSHALKPYIRVTGWFYSMETTFNSKTRKWHPHIHAMLNSPYIPQQQASRAWRKAAIKFGFPRVIYKVDLRQVKPDHDSVEKAFIEASKYYMKPVAKKLTDKHSSILAEVLTAVRSLRVVESGGDMTIPPVKRRKKSPYQIAISLRRWLKSQTRTQRTAEVKSRVLRDNVLSRIALKKYSLTDLAPVKDPSPWTKNCAKNSTKNAARH
jgi:hypothetical protein